MSCISKRSFLWPTLRSGRKEEPVKLQFLLHRVMVWCALGQEQCMKELQKDYRLRLKKASSAEIAANWPAG